LAPQETAAVGVNRYEKAVHDADLPTARRIAEALGVPLAFLYVETKGAAVLTWAEWSKPEQRQAVADLKARLTQSSGGGRGA
jgi:hypothetical protein